MIIFFFFNPCLFYLCKHHGAILLVKIGDHVMDQLNSEILVVEIQVVVWHSFQYGIELGAAVIL